MDLVLPGPRACVRSWRRLYLEIAMTLFVLCRVSLIASRGRNAGIDGANSPCDRKPGNFSYFWMELIRTNGPRIVDWAAVQFWHRVCFWSRRLTGVKLSTMQM